MQKVLMPIKVRRSDGSVDTEQDYFYLASDVDARIAELEGLLHDLLLLDESIGNRLRLPHGWSDEDKRRHALELTAREQKQTDARKAIGHLLEPCHQTPGMECSIAGPCAHYREAHKPRTVTHIPDSSGLTLPQLEAGKQALYACSEDPSFDDVRRVIAAVAGATQRNNRPASREGE